MHESWLQGKPFGKNQVRKVILSAAIHPDFEEDTVIMPLVRIKRNPVIGELAVTHNYQINI